MSPLFLLRHICEHPLNRHRKAAALFDFARWQIRSRFTRSFVTYSWLNLARILLRKGDSGFTMNIYCGLYDFSEMTYLLHALRKDDLFVDVGANIGSYTLLASAVRKARSISFEPIPESFSRLKDNLEVNHLNELVTAHNLGIGDKPAAIRFSTTENCNNHVLCPDEKLEGI